MKLIIWIGLAVIQVLFVKLNVLSFLEKISLTCHLSALHYLETIPSQWNWFFEAVLIGRNEGLRGRSELQSFFTLGIYYLLVVSGIHVLAVERAIQKLFWIFPSKLKSKAVFFTLIIFCLINRNQPPCFRALVWYFVSKKRKKTLKLQGDLQMIVTCLCLFIQPTWILSVSFQMSCAATLGLAIASSFKIENSIGRRLLSTVFCTTLMGPLLFYMQPCLSWLIVPANIVALPLFEIMIMPISMLTSVIHPLVKVTEILLKGLFSLTDYFAQFENPLWCLDERKMAGGGLIYIFGVYLTWRLVVPLFFFRRFWKEQEVITTHRPLRP